MTHFATRSVGTLALCLMAWNTGCIFDDSGRSAAQNRPSTEGGVEYWSPPAPINGGLNDGGTSPPPMPWDGGPGDGSPELNDGGTAPLDIDNQDGDGGDNGNGGDNGPPPIPPVIPDVFWTQSQSTMITAPEAVNMNDGGHDFADALLNWNGCHLPLVQYEGTRGDHFDRLTTDNCLAYNLEVGDVSEIWVWFGVIVVPGSQKYFVALEGDDRYISKALLSPVATFVWVRAGPFAVERNSEETLLLAGHEKGIAAMFLFVTSQEDERPPPRLWCINDD